MNVNAFDRAILIIKGLHRSRRDKEVSGVCGGLAESTGIPSWFYRTLFVCGVLFYGTGILIYAILAFSLPEKDFKDPEALQLFQLLQGIQSSGYQLVRFSDLGPEERAKELAIRIEQADLSGIIDSSDFMSMLDSFSYVLPNEINQEAGDSLREKVRMFIDKSNHTSDVQG